MEYRLSKRMANLKPSAIREILKAAGDPNLISFAAGNPAPEAFPSKELGKIAADIFAEEPVNALQYSITEGYPKLRNQVREILKERQNLDQPEMDVIITSGAQQGIELAAKVLCDPGDCIICENPSFIGSLNSFRSQGITLLGVPMEEDGMDLAALEETLKAHPTTKLMYIIANFQNPTGRTTGLAKRQGIYALAKQYDVVILEDDPYGELRFAGQKVPTIKSLDTEGRVIYCGSFSKTVAPGLRLGYLYAHQNLLAKITVAKQGEDVHTSMPSQMMASRFLAQHDYAAHLKKLAEIYRKKANLMLCEMEKHFDPKVTWTKPEGGLFIWCTLPQHVDMLAFCKEATARMVAVVPGVAFNVDTEAPSNAFRMNYSTPTDEQIIKGVEILGALTREVCR